MSSTELLLGVTDLSGKEVGSFAVDTEALGGKVRRRLLKDVLVMYERNQRQGNSSTLSQAEVATSTKKPWRQKGTGRARAGTRSSNIWRGGAVAHGPRPKDWTLDIPVKMRRRALGSALLAKIQDGKVRVVDSLKLAAPSTRTAIGVAEALGVTGRTVVANHEMDSNQLLSFRNIAWIESARVEDLNALTVMRSQFLVITREGLENVVSRVSMKDKRPASVVSV